LWKCHCCPQVRLPLLDLTVNHCIIGKSPSAEPAPGPIAEVEAAVAAEAATVVATVAAAVEAVEVVAAAEAAVAAAVEAAEGINKYYLYKE